MKLRWMDAGKSDLEITYGNDNDIQSGIKWIILKSHKNKWTNKCYENVENGKTTIKEGTERNNYYSLKLAFIYNYTDEAQHKMQWKYHIIPPLHQIQGNVLRYPKDSSRWIENLAMLCMTQGFLF